MAVCHQIRVKQQVLMKNHLPPLSVTDEELINMAKDFREGILQGGPSTGACAMIS